jgi:uncharacterized membrane protein YphA (DoxX/SURF4 family)
MPLLQYGIPRGALEVANQKRLASWTHLINKMILFLRIVLGCLFIYSGLFKALNPSVFEIALRNYGIIPDNIFKLVSTVFPLIEITLGILLIFKLFINIATIFTVALYLLFILLTIISVIKGTAGGCGCFSESFILNFYDPILIVIRNVVLATIAILVFIQYKNDLITVISIKNNALKLMWFFLLSISISIILVLIGKRDAENKRFRMYLADRKTVMAIVEEINLTKYSVRDIITNNDIISSAENKYTLIFIINSMDCGSCIDEAMFVEYLSNKYINELKTIGIAGLIGNTAIKNLIDRYHITYNIIQGRSPALQKMQNIKTLKILVNSEGNIINIDPATFRSKKIRKDYENILLKYLNK